MEYMENETGNRAIRLRKGETSIKLCGMALCAKTHAWRQRQLPTDELSCGSQPAYIRVIIVATVYPGSLFHFPCRKRVKYGTKPVEKWKSPAKNGGTFPLSHRLY